MRKQWYTWASIQTIGSCVDTSLCLTAEIFQAHIWCRAKKGKYYSFKKASSIEWFWWWLSRRHCHPSVCQFFSISQSKGLVSFSDHTADHNNWVMQDNTAESISLLGPTGTCEEKHWTKIPVWGLYVMAWAGTYKAIKPCKLQATS